MADVTVPIVPSTEYEIGCKYYAQCKYKEALACFLNISLNKTHPYYLAACLKLWLIYKLGFGIAIDPAKAGIYGKIVADNVDWFKQAAASGNADANYNLGCLYRDSLGVVQDLAQARAWYEKAAASGLVVARENLAQLPRPKPRP